MFILNCMAGIVLLVLMLVVIYCLTSLILGLSLAVVSCYKKATTNILFMCIFVRLFLWIYPMVRPVVNGLVK